MAYSTYNPATSSGSLYGWKLHKKQVQETGQPMYVDPFESHDSSLEAARAISREVWNDGPHLHNPSLVGHPLWSGWPEDEHAIMLSIVGRDVLEPDVTKHAGARGNGEQTRRAGRQSHKRG
jgi:hypothetical protein